MWTLTASATQPMLSPMLLAELADFVAHHRPCGQLSGDATELALDHYMLSVGWSSGPALTDVMRTARRW